MKQGQSSSKAGKYQSCTQQTEKMLHMPCPGTLQRQELDFANSTIGFTCSRNRLHILKNNLASVQFKEALRVGLVLVGFFSPLKESRREGIGKGSKEEAFPALFVANVGLCPIQTVAGRRCSRFMHCLPGT